MSDQDIASHIVLSSGEVRTLALRSLAMAGYQWFGALTGDDPECVSLTLRRGEIKSASKPGVSVPEEALLRGVRPGRAVVRLEQRRPWEVEENEPPAQFHEIGVEVRA